MLKFKNERIGKRIASLEKLLGRELIDGVGIRYNSYYDKHSKKLYSIIKDVKKS